MMGFTPTNNKNNMITYLKQPYIKQATFMTNINSNRIAK